MDGWLPQFSWISIEFLLLDVGCQSNPRSSPIQLEPTTVAATPAHFQVVPSRADSRGPLALLPVGAPGSRLPRSPVWQAASDVSEDLTGTSRCWPLDWMLDVSGSDYASFLHVASKQQQPPTCIHFVLLLPSRSSPDQNTISGANHFGSRSPPRAPVSPDPDRAPLA